MIIDDLLRHAVKLGASDIHITAELEPTARLNGKLIKISKTILKKDDTLSFAKHVLGERDLKLFQSKGEIDTSYAIENVSRFRVNVYRQKGACAIAFRVISDEIPSMEQLSLPPILRDLSKKQRGLILITGPTGSGKSTSLATMIDYMNHHLNHHIITIEDPIEYLHHHKKSMVNQREIGQDTLTFANALRAALREDPDVILVGEMRDLETISTALTAAETGHLVLSTLHTIGAAKTIDRIIDVFPPEQQQQIRVQLAAVLEAVISQQLMVKADGNGRIPAFEVMLGVPAVRNLVREGKTHQLETIIQTGAGEQMQTMDNNLLGLFRKGFINMETLLRYSVDTEFVKKQVGNGAGATGLKLT